MTAASPCGLPEYMLNGTTSGSDSLIARAASSSSSQDFGAQSSGRPAAASTSLLNQSPRVSVPMETP